jgi:RNA methyltransferase, TrmH family
METTPNKILTKTRLKFIKSLQDKKQREKNSLFVAEGEKIVEEILHSSLEIILIAATYDVFNKFEKLNRGIEIIEVKPFELEMISSFKTPNKVLAVAKIPKYTPDFDEVKNGISLFLEDIQDPGNLGTILRIADWFGIRNIFCSLNSVEVYNPKVVQATMGSICRVKTYYVDKNELMLQCKRLNDFPIYGTFLQGENIYQTELKDRGIIVLGNESKGISEEMEAMVTERLNIPNFAQTTESSESLNISIATAIVCSEFRRRTSSF